MSRARVVVIGDIGGHASQLRWVLEACGATEAVPPGTTIIQVGDLIDRGPASAEVLDIVDRYVSTQPDRWVQLVGNHEAQYLHYRSQFWQERLGETQQAILRRWWHNEQMRVAAAVRDAQGDEYLITHAGLTRGCWQDLEEPMTASTASMRLNQRPDELLWRGPFIDPQDAAGPLWAESGWELHEPWMEYCSGGGFVPFGQIHGHSAIVGYGDHSWRASEKVRQRACADWRARHFRVRIGGRQFIGIDPKHGKSGAAQWQPLIFEEAEVIAASIA
jgi:hypothetical protein